jgi:quinol-cytochrome oxidoreductase complex cytochrome b subunit
VIKQQRCAAVSFWKKHETFKNKLRINVMKGRGDRMTKYIVFLFSFLFIFMAIQIGSGILLTWLYTPDPAKLWSEAAQAPAEVQFVGPNFGMLFISAVLALVISLLIMKLFRRFSRPHHG